MIEPHLEKVQQYEIHLLPPRGVLGVGVVPGQAHLVQTGPGSEFVAEEGEIGQFTGVLQGCGNS